MGGAGARANIAALDAAMAAELAWNTVDGPGENPVNADQPPGPFDKLSKMDYKHLARKLDIQYKTNRIVMQQKKAEQRAVLEEYLKAKTENLRNENRRNRNLDGNNPNNEDDQYQ